jgi:NAD(P) transhydrogenase subunit alpha
MNFEIAITGFVAIYIFMLAAFGGWVIIGDVPAILHTPLMSGSNFVHGIVVVGGIFALLNASTLTEQIIGFFAVLLGAGNVAGGYAVTARHVQDEWSPASACSPCKTFREEELRSRHVLDDCSSRYRYGGPDRSVSVHVRPQANVLARLCSFGYPRCRHRHAHCHSGQFP